MTVLVKDEAIDNAPPIARRPTCEVVRDRAGPDAFPGGEDCPSHSSLSDGKTDATLVGFRQEVHARCLKAALSRPE